MNILVSYFSLMKKKLNYQTILRKDKITKVGIQNKRKERYLESSLQILLELKLPLESNHMLNHIVQKIFEQMTCVRGI